MPALAYIAVPPHIAPGSTPAAKSQPDFGFGDFLDLINPLQHIPVISTLYRHLTGDKIGTPAKIAGDTLYGGAVGFLCSMGDTLFEGLTGKDVGDTVYAYLSGDEGKSEATGFAAAPADVVPADGIHVAMPDLSFLSETPDSDVPQRAATAYGKALRSYEAV
jgi:hypothetical protein